MRSADKPDSGGVAPFPECVPNDHLARLQDPERLASLDETDLLDSPEEEAFDRAVRLAKALTGSPTALLSLVDGHRQFFKAKDGLEPDDGEIRETPLSHSFCQYVVGEDQALGVIDARAHPLLSKNGAVADYGIVAYLGVPVHGRRGQVIGSLCAIDAKPHAWSEADQAALEDLAAMVETEIGLRKMASERQLLIDELNHRIGNLFSIINGLVRMSGRESLSVDGFVDQLDQRIQALVTTHHLIQPLAGPEARNDASQVALGAHVAALMMPYATGEAGRVVMEGPDVTLEPMAASYLALALNELATNALKYGALQSPEGQVSIRWSADDATLEFVWHEEGIAQVDAAAPGFSTGFGGRLMRVCIEHQLRGRMKMDVGGDSLTYTFIIPRDALET